MQSLRTRKPSEARSRGQQRPSANKPGKSSSRDVNRRATRVDDKIKKRMSMRYADISSPTATSVPALPTIPLALRSGHGQRSLDDDADALIEDRGEAAREDQREADLRMLDQESFDPDTCK